VVKKIQGSVYSVYLWGFPGGEDLCHDLLGR